MKKIIGLTLALALVGCGRTACIDGKTYDTYGLLNQDSSKNSKIEYRLIVGNVIWSVILCESIVFPLYFIGFSLYEPIGKAGDADTKGVIN